MKRLFPPYARTFLGGSRINSCAPRKLSFTNDDDDDDFLTQGKVLLWHKEMPKKYSQEGSEEAGSLLAGLVPEASR